MGATECRIRKDARVLEVEDEREPDGIWAYLKPNFCNHAMRGGECTQGGCVHNVHKATWSDLERALRKVGPCNCGDCNP